MFVLIAQTLSAVAPQILQRRSSIQMVPYSIQFSVPSLAYLYAVPVDEDGSGGTGPVCVIA